MELRQEKLKPIVDRFCKEKGIKCISVSTIGRIMQRKKLSYYARTGRFFEREKKKRVKKRIKCREIREAGGVRRYLIVGKPLGRDLDLLMDIVICRVETQEILWRSL
jgi:hypothetical protein